MNLVDVIEKKFVAENRDATDEDYARNHEISKKFIECIKNYTRGQVALTGRDAEDATETFLFREPGGAGWSYWVVHGIMQDLGYHQQSQDRSESSDELFIKAMKDLGMSRGDALHVIDQRED